MKFLKKEYAHENFEFWNAINNLKKKSPQGEKLKKEVKTIYNLYIDDNATNPVSIQYVHLYV